MKASGLYHYRVAGVEREAGGPGERVFPEQGHVLERIGALDISVPLAEAALDQGLVARAAAVFVWTAVYERSRWKYRERAYRYVYLDAGHVAAQLSLAAVALGLGSCQIGAFFDSEVDSLLGIDGVNEGTVYLSAVGGPARPRSASQGQRERGALLSGPPSLG
ncbi:MAG: SagB/ThcOx family dehydrogenase [Actinobacteria bacterium]|nr:SagB/ThcOx family dehydrogenase [Actinomycetota bacterium]